MRMHSVVVAAFASAFFSATGAQAALVSYFDFTTWSSAVPSTTSVTIPDPGSSTFIGSGSASIVYSGVTFATNGLLSDGEFFNIGSNVTDGTGGFPAVLSSQQQSTGTPNILITLTGPTNAFSLSYGTFYGGDVIFLLSNGDILTLPSTGNGYDTPDFFGATDSTPFTSVLVTTPDQVLSLNNVAFGSAVSAVPELSSWAMLLLGFAGIGCVGYRRSHRSAEAPPSRVC